MENKKQRFVTLTDYQAYLGLGRYAAKRFGQRIGAERQIGKLYVYDLDLTNDALHAARFAETVRAAK